MRIGLRRSKHICRAGASQCLPMPHTPCCGWRPTIFVNGAIIHTDGGGMLLNARRRL
jgi:hypothetical protein